MELDLYSLVEGARHGRFLVNPRDEYIGRSLLAYGEWGEAEVRLFGKIIDAGDTVVEAGSNIGSHTVPLSKLTGPLGQVLAFEPQRLTFQLLCANLALNGCINVRALNAAAGEASGSIPVTTIDPLAEFNFGGVRLNAGYEASIGVEPVPLMTIDELDLDSLDLLKADVEGGELAVLRGAHSSIRRFGPAIYVEANDLDDFKVYDFLSGLGYTCYWYITPIFDHGNYRAHTEDIWAEAHRGCLVCSIDMLAVPRDGRWRIEGLLEVDPASPLDVNRLPIDPDNYQSLPKVTRRSTVV